MKRYLFVCSQNRLRSPTAEQIFAAADGVEVLSAGTNNDAETPLSSELVKWADTIFVMERTHRSKVQKRFRRSLNGKRIVCLDIPDDYEFMDPELIRLLQARMSRFLPGGNLWSLSQKRERVYFRRTAQLSVLPPSSGVRLTTR